MVPRTVTNLARTMGRSASQSHDACEYFFSGAVWAMDDVWRILFNLILASRLIARDAVIEPAGDDTLVPHKVPQDFRRWHLSGCGSLHGTSRWRMPPVTTG